MVTPQHFRLLTLGAPLLVSAAGEVVSYRTRKHFALLLRLAIEPGKRLTRDYLIDLLWGTVSPARGAHSLAQALTVLRATIGRQHVLAQGTTVGLVKDIIDVDVHHLDDCTAEIGGRFLDGFELSRTPGFEHWKDATAAQLSPKIRDCLVRRMDAGRRIGDFESVEKNAQILESLDPLSEDALRGLMEARAWAGDRTGALQAFTRIGNRLSEDLGVTPSADIVRMATLLRAGRRPSPRPKEGDLPPREERRLEPELLIGREKEFSALYDAWLAIRKREPRVVVVTGDPGIGKTTLVNAFASSCQMEGAVVSRTQAFDAERDLPFAVLAELVRQLVLEKAVQSADPDALSELTRITPEIFAEYPGVARPIDWAPEITPLRLADSFLKAVTAAAQDSPVVLVVDDIHAADNASVAILHLVARKLADLRLLLILTARPTELRLTRSFTIADDDSISGLRRIELDALSPESATALIRRTSKQRTDHFGEPPVSRILRAGSGNPLALELLAREWAEHGPESLITQLETLDTQPAPSIGIPPAIRTVFDKQTQRLESRTRAVLDLAAVLGRRLSELALYGIVDCSPGEAAAHLSRLLEDGILREVQGKLEFRNELVRAQAYYGMAASLRKQLHRKVAETLLRISVNRVAAGHSLEVAWHLLRGGEVKEAHTYGLEGAEACISSGAPAEAEQILRVLTEQTSIDGLSRVLLLLARALLDQSKAAECRPILDRLSECGDLQPAASAEACLLRASAEYLLNRDVGEPYKRAAAGALEAARKAGQPRLIIRALFEYARAGVEAGNETMIREAHNEVSTLLNTQSYQNLFAAHYACGFCETRLFEVREGAKRMGQALSLALEGESPVEVSRAYTGLGVINHFLCDTQSGLVALEKALEITQNIGDEGRASVIATNICATQTACGRYLEAIEAGRKAVEWGSRFQSQPYLVGMAYTNLIDPYFLTGQRDSAELCLNAASKWLTQDRSWYSRTSYLSDVANFALITANRDLALRTIEELEKVGMAMLAMPQPGMAVKLLTYRACQMGDLTEALEISRRATAQYRNRCPLVFMDAVGARAWAEHRTLGTYSEETRQDLRRCESFNVPGKRALLAAQGFLPQEIGVWNVEPGFTTPVGLLERS